MKDAKAATDPAGGKLTQNSGTHEVDATFSITKERSDVMMMRVFSISHTLDQKLPLQLDL